MGVHSFKSKQHFIIATESTIQMKHLFPKRFLINKSTITESVFRGMCSPRSFSNNFSQGLIKCSYFKFDINIGENQIVLTHTGYYASYTTILRVTTARGVLYHFVNQRLGLRKVTKWHNLPVKLSKME